MPDYYYCYICLIIVSKKHTLLSGFVPFWLGSVLGQSLLLIVNEAGPLGTVFIYAAWKVLIVAFEAMSREIGGMASRTSDGSVFSFCAIYTGIIHSSPIHRILQYCYILIGSCISKRHLIHIVGATYAEFIFLSVVFNSAKFWALLCFEFLVIALWFGGLNITVTKWIADNVSGAWPIVHRLKTWFFCLIGSMPHEVAERAALFTKDNAPPDVQLALIRSRAVVVHETWTENDIKMASEFQSCACAVTAVAADMIFSYYNIGSDIINATMSEKRQLLYIYIVNLAVLLIAQAIARAELKKKVNCLDNMYASARLTDLMSIGCASRWNN